MIVLTFDSIEQLPLFLAELHRGIARRKLRPFPPVKEVLDQLRPHYRMAAVSNAQHAYGVAELYAVGLLDYFDPVIISGDCGYCKPDPRLFQKALDALQVQPEQALFIGNDMYCDVFGPQLLGMKTIFFSPTEQKKSQREIHPDYIIYNLAELPRAVKHFVNRAQ